MMLSASALKLAFREACVCCACVLLTSYTAVALNMCGPMGSVLAAFSGLHVKRKP